MKPKGLKKTFLETGLPPLSQGLDDQVPSPLPSEGSSTTELEGRNCKPRHPNTAGDFERLKRAGNSIQSMRPVRHNEPIRKLGPRAGRVTTIIQHGFPFRKCRRVLCAQCVGSLSNVLYFTMDSVGIISVNIYSYRVSSLPLSSRKMFVVLFHWFHSFAFLSKQYANVLWNNNLLHCYCFLCLEKFTSTSRSP